MRSNAVKRPLLDQWEELILTAGAKTLQTTGQNIVAYSGISLILPIFRAYMCQLIQFMPSSQ